MMMKSMAKKAMKAMKAKMAKKSMKKRAMKKSDKNARTAKTAVFKGKIAKTRGGNDRSTLMKNKHGKIASKKLGKWLKAVAAARKALAIKGMVPVGGKSAKGQALYKKAKSLYK